MKPELSTGAQDVFKDFTVFLDALPFGVIVLNSNLTVVAFNSNLSDFNSYLNLQEIKEGAKFPELEFVKEHNLAEEINNLQFLPFERILKEISVRKGVISVRVKGSPIFYNDKFFGAFLIVEDNLTGKEKKIPESQKLLKILTNLYDVALLVNDYSVVEELSFAKSKSYLKNLFGFSKGKKLKRVVLSKGDDKEIELTAILKEALVKNKFILFNELGMNEKYFNLFILPAEEKKIILLINEITESVTERITTEEEIKSLLEYRNISEKIRGGLILLNTKGAIEEWSSKCEEIFGLPKSKVYNKFLGKIIPDLTEEFFESIKGKLSADREWSSYFNIGTGVKEEILKLKFFLLKDKKIGVIVSVETEQALLEKELRQKERLYRDIIANIGEFIFILNEKGDIEFVNQSFVQNLNYSENEVIGKSITDFIEVKFKRKNKDIVKKLLKSKNVSLEIPLRSKKGEVFYTLAKINPVIDINGTIARYNAIFIDITAQKESQKDLLLIRTVFEASIDAITVVKNRKIILANHAFASMFGFENISSVINKDPLDFCDEKDLNRLAGVIQKIEKNQSIGQRLEFTGVKQDGSKFFIENSLTSYKTDGEVFIVSVLRDVTERKIYQDKLEQSERQLRKITERINDFIWNANIVNGKLKQTFYTIAVKKLTGYEPEDFVKNQKLWLEIIHPKDKESVVKKLKEFYRNKETLSQSIEYRMINKNGNILWIKNSINVERDNNGKILQLVGLVSDITLAKHAEEELKRSAEELKRLNQTKDKFLSIISHDLRTPFSSILGYTNILLNDRNLSEDKKVEYISFIQDSAKNMLSLVNSLLDWTRLQTGRIKFEPGKINAALVINNSIQMLNGTAMKKNIRLVANVGREINVYADKDLLLQVFNNLISNSIKFTEPGGFIEITSAFLPEKKMVEFCVRDSGVGIKQEDLDKLFRVDAKFTREGTSGEKGSGLGLSLCADIVKKHGGEIRVESRLNEGSKFFFTIPVSSSTILLVDDIKTDRILYSKLIKSLLPEFEIIDAPNGKVALELIRKIHPALVISENNLPLISGVEFVKQILINTEIEPKPGVIILSRKISNKDINEYKDIGIEHIFTKPVNLNEFKLAIENSIKV